MTAAHAEVVIIGAGAAGLSAALILSRARRSVVVIDGGEPRNGASDHLHGFLSQEGQDPSALIALGREEVESYGGVIRNGIVRSIERRTEFAHDVSWSGGTVTCDAVLVATGLADRLPDIPGVWEEWGRTVFHCPYCHGYEVNQEPVAVIGGLNQEFSMKQAGLMTQWSEQVTLFVNGMKVTADERGTLENLGVIIDDATVAEVDPLEGAGVTVESDIGGVREFAAAFVGPMFEPNDHLLRIAGCEVGDDGFVVVDDAGRTSRKGLWAAGNVVSSPAQLINAAAAGATAAIGINDSLIFDTPPAPSGLGTWLRMDEDFGDDFNPWDA